MDAIVKRLMENHRVNESRSIDVKKLESEIKEKVKEIMTSPSFGFEVEKDPDDKYSIYYDDYSTVEVYDKDEYYEVEVRAELSYDSMMEMADQLNPIVAKYDEDAYFDMVDSGIMSAYIMK